MSERPPGYSMRELQRLAEAPLRRPWLVVVPFVLSVVAAVAASFLLPPRYRSSTLILVAPEQMPANFVPQMSTERVARRLQTLRQEVQSRTRLETVAREFDPYGLLGKKPLIDTIERMRDAITVSVKGNDAFTIEFEHQDPKMAMLVADRLTTLFMEEVVGSRERQVSTAYEFIEKQLQDARQQLEEKEEALRQYKEQHMGQLPEQVQANLSTLQRLQLEQQSVADSLRKATDAQLLLEGVSTSGGGVVAPGATPAPDSLAAMRALMAQLKTRYTDEHPDVRALQSRIDALEKASASSEPGAPPPDPAAAAQQLRLREARIEVQSLRARLVDVDRRIAAFQARVEAAPRREQEILGLTRDYQKLSENYTQLLSKKLDAEMATRLEAQQRGQEFRILDPAYMPERPSFPNRLLFAVAGVLVGLLLGIGLAVVIDVLDPTMKDAESVADAFEFPVLAVIPYVKPREQSRLATMPEAKPDSGKGAGGGAGGRRGRRLIPFRGHGRASGRSASRPR
jgi:polysaccharide chain length determinant protein (PEP-CTERM system associated)